MFYICRRKVINDIVYYGIMDTVDGVIEDYTVKDILKIIRKTNIQIDGVSSGVDGKVYITVLKPTQYAEVSKEEYVDATSVKNTIISGEPFDIRNMFKGIKHSGYWGNVGDAILKPASTIDCTKDYIDFKFYYTYNTSLRVPFKYIKERFDSLKNNLPVGLTLHDYPTDYILERDDIVCRLHLDNSTMTKIYQEVLALSMMHSKTENIGNACCFTTKIASNVGNRTDEIHYNLGTIIIPIKLGIRRNFDDYDYLTEKLLLTLENLNPKSPKFTSILCYIQETVFSYKTDDDSLLCNYFDYEIKGNVAFINLKPEYKPQDLLRFPEIDDCYTGFRLTRDNKGKVESFSLFKEGSVAPKTLRCDTSFSRTYHDLLVSIAKCLLVKTLGAFFVKR